MDPKSGKPLRLLVNPFALWTHYALKTGESILASAQAAAARANAPKVAVIPSAEPAQQKTKPAKRASKAARPKAARAKVRSKAKAKRRAKR